MCIIRIKPHRISDACTDIYGKGFAGEILSVKTAYEAVYLKEGLPITYLRYSLGGRKSFAAPDFDGEDFEKR